MKNNKLARISSHSLSGSTISFSSSMPKSNGKYYRSITESPANNYSINNQEITHFVPSHIKTQSKSLYSDYPKCIQQQQPLDILLTSMGIDNDEDNDEKYEEYRYYNELNSYLVEDCSSIKVLKTLSNILSNYNDDIDFKINYNEKQIDIDGLVFISNYSVFFIIYVWEENKGNNNHSKQTRFEFRRKSGDSLASAKFWAQIKGKYQQQINDKNNNEYDLDFISLDLDLNDFCDNNNNKNNVHLNKTELDEITECMIRNDLFVVDELNFLYDLMIKNKNICFDILSHQEIMKELINESLLNKDICVSRIVLLILDKLSKIENNNNMTNNTEFKLFNNINLLLNHKCQLIKKYTIRLLSNLLNNKWKIDDISRYQMIENIKKYENECTNNLNQEMIKKIKQKLMMKQ